jgi:hypothetical protein
MSGPLQPTDDPHHLLLSRKLVSKKIQNDNQRLSSISGLCKVSRPGHPRLMFELPGAITLAVQNCGGQATRCRWPA